MVGKKGKSGGPRKGAGRPPEVIRIGRKFSIRAGQQVLIRSKFEDGITRLRMATVELEGASRNRTINLHCDDGETIIIAMLS